MLFNSLFFGLDTIGFSGSRSLSGAGLAALTSLFALVPAGCHVVVGCAAGADLAVRSAFEDGRLCLFAVDSGRWGSGRAAFARRSVAIVEAVPSGGLLVVIPSSVSPPPGVIPSRSFHGGGSGSWGSATLALGTGRRMLLWLPVGAVPGQPHTFRNKWQPEKRECVEVGELIESLRSILCPQSLAPQP